MDISKSIERIKGYFKFLNVTDDASYILVKFPDTWEVPSTLEDGDVQTKKDKNGYYFVIDGTDRIDVLFESIESVIDYNKDMEQKAELLVKKIRELKELFETEDLDKLNKMEFSFEKDTFPLLPKKGKSEEKNSKKQENSKEEKDETSSNSIMDAAKELVKEG